LTPAPGWPSRLSHAMLLIVVRSSKHVSFLFFESSFCPSFQPLCVPLIQKLGMYPCFRHWAGSAGFPFVAIANLSNAIYTCSSPEYDTQVEDQLFTSLDLSRVCFKPLLSDSSIVSLSLWKAMSLPMSSVVSKRVMLSKIQKDMVVHRSRTCVGRTLTSFELGKVTDILIFRLLKDSSGLMLFVTPDPWSYLYN